MNATITPPGLGAGGSAPDACVEQGPREISQLFSQLSDSVMEAIGEISDINSDTQLLALNARIEAARAGSSGAAFGVVAQEMQALGAKTATIATELASRSKRSIDELVDLIGGGVRGRRLADLARTNVDLVDRNLYERTCDVRWWATDASVVDALAEPTPERLEYASHRLGVILSAYTVYHDLVLCDLSGAIVANGRPDLYRSVGQNAARSHWFQQSAHSASGDEFGFETAHRSPLVGDRSVLVYSCGVREGGQSHGRLVGVLGVLFNWETFAQTIVEQTPLAESEREATRCLICDATGKILADSWGRQLQESLSVPSRDDLFRRPKSYTTVSLDGVPHCVAQALAPGFETYTTGWRGVILQRVD